MSQDDAQKYQAIYDKYTKEINILNEQAKKKEKNNTYQRNLREKKKELDDEEMQRNKTKWR